VHLLGSPLVLFPPLFVMAFERIAHASWLFPVHTLVGTAWLLLLMALWERGFFQRLVAWNRLN
jgi:hypothetical protein